MLYHSIGYATRKIGRGGFPQSQHSDLEFGKKVTDPDYVWNLRGDEMPLFKPYIGTVVLRDGSAITDFISSATISVGFVCSDTVQSLVKRTNFGKTYFHDLSLKHKNTIYPNYTLMHCLNNYSTKIDYNKSIFKRLRVENNEWVGDRYNIKSFEEARGEKTKMMRNVYGDWNRLEPSIIKLKEGDSIVHDIFTIWGITFRVYASERLRQLFDKAKITGLQYNFDSEPLEII